MSVVGDNIKKRRKALKLSQKQLAKLADVSQAGISDIENGGKTRTPYTDTILKIARALGCTVADLTGETEISEGDGLSWTERKIISDFRALNSIGKEKVLSYIADLLDMPKYTEETLLPSQLV